MKNKKKQEYITVPIDAGLNPFYALREFHKESYENVNSIPYIVPFFKGRDIIDYLKKYQEEHNLQQVKWGFDPHASPYKGKCVYVAFDDETKKPVAVANTPYIKEFDKLNFLFFTVPLYKS